MAFEFNMASVDVLQASFCGMDITPCKFPSTPASSIPPPPAFDEAVSPSAPSMSTFAPSQSFFTPGAPSGKPKKKVIGTGKKIEDEFPKLSIHVTSAPPPPSSSAFPPPPSFGTTSLAAPSFHAGTKEGSGRVTPRRARKSMEKGVPAAHANPYPSVGPKVQSFAFGPPPHPPPRTNNTNNNSGSNDSTSPNATNNIPQHNNNKRVSLADLKKLIESVAKAERSSTRAHFLALAAQQAAEQAQQAISNLKPLPTPMPNFTSSFANLSFGPNPTNTNNDHKNDTSNEVPVTFHFSSVPPPPANKPRSAVPPPPNPASAAGIPANPYALPSSSFSANPTSAQSETHWNPFFNLPPNTSSFFSATTSSISQQAPPFSFSAPPPVFPSTSTTTTTTTSNAFPAPPSFASIPNPAPSFFSFPAPPPVKPDMSAKPPTVPSSIHTTPSHAPSFANSFSTPFSSATTSTFYGPSPSLPPAAKKVNLQKTPFIVPSAQSTQTQPNAPSGHTHLNVPLNAHSMATPPPPPRPSSHYSSIPAPPPRPSTNTTFSATATTATTTTTSSATHPSTPQAPPSAGFESPRSFLRAKRSEGLSRGTTDDKENDKPASRTSTKTASGAKKKVSPTNAGKKTPMEKPAMEKPVREQSAEKPKPKTSTSSKETEKVNEKMADDADESEEEVVFFRRQPSAYSSTGGGGNSSNTTNVNANNSNGSGNVPAGIDTWSTKQLMRELTKLGVATDGCLEKSELIQKVRSYYMQTFEQRKAEQSKQRAKESAEKVQKDAEKTKDKAILEIATWAKKKNIMQMLNDVNGKKSTDPGYLRATDSLETIAKAYKKALLIIHPDKNMGDELGHLRATERFKYVHEAMESHKASVEKKQYFYSAQYGFKPNSTKPKAGSQFW